MSEPRQSSIQPRKSTVQLNEQQKQFLQEIERGGLFKKSCAHRMHSAARDGNLEAIKALLDEVRSKLIQPSFSGDSSYLKQLIEHRNPDNNNQTPLLEATRFGHLNVVEFLVEECGANIRARSSHQLRPMPIHLAAFYGQLDILQFFLEVDPDLLEATTPHNDTPLCAAAFGGRLTIVRFLVEIKRANVEARGWGGRTPLLQAVTKGYIEIVAYLIGTGGANIYAKDSNDNEGMAIHSAAYFGHPEVVSYLLTQNRDLLEARDKLGQTPLAIAKSMNKNGVIAVLEDRGARS